MTSSPSQPVLLSYEEARDLAITVAQRRGPNHRDRRGGQYFRNGRPACLVGAMMAEKGIDATTLTESNSDNITSPGVMGVFGAADGRGEDFLLALQIQNDQGELWFDAVRYALDAVGDDPKLLDRPPAAQPNAAVVEEFQAWMESLPAPISFTVPAIPVSSLCPTTVSLEQEKAAVAV